MSRLLVLDFNEKEKIASCFLKRHHGLFLFKIEKRPSPTPGHFLIYNGSLYENEVIKTNNVRNEPATEDDCIQFDRNGGFSISAWIAFSSNPEHRSFNRKVAFTDWYGFADCTEVKEILEETYKMKDAFKTFIEVKDLNYVRNQTQLFKVKIIKGPFSKNDQNLEKLMKDMNEYENNLLEDDNRLSVIKPQRPSRSVDSNSSGNGKKRARSRSRQRNNGVANGSSSNDKSIRPNLEYALQNISQLEKLSSRPIENVSSNQKDFGMIMVKVSYEKFIVWLKEKKASALLMTSKVGNVRMGFYYEIEYSPLQNDNDLVFEVVKIIKRLEGLPFRIHQSDLEVLAGFNVDLSSPNTKFRDWSFHMDIPFFNSPDVGIATIIDSVEILEIKKRWQEAIRPFIGNPCASKMECICRLVKQKLPRKMFDETETNEFKSIDRYTWQILKIYASEEYAKDNEKALREQNFPNGSHHFQDDDELAREKREARGIVRFGENSTRLISNNQPSTSSNYMN